MLRRTLTLIIGRNVGGRSQEALAALRNAASSSADYLLAPVIWLVTTPIFVSRLGIEQYGIWMLVNSCIGLSSLMGFGLSDAIVKYVSKYRAAESLPSVVTIVRSSLTLSGILGLVACLAVSLGGPVLVSRDVFKIDQRHVALTVSVFRIAGLGILVRFIDSVYVSTIHGHQRYDIVAATNMIATVVTAVTNVCLVLGPCGLRAVIAATVIALALVGAARMVIAGRMLSPRTIVIPGFSRDALREVLGFGVYTWAQNGAGLLISQVDRLLVAGLLGTSALGYYTVCLQLAQQIHALLARASSFLFPMVSAMTERGDLGRLRGLYCQGLRLTTVAGVTLGVPLFLFSEAILSLWVGPAFAEQAASTLRILAFFYAVFCTSVVPYYCLNGGGFVRLNTLFGLLSGSVVLLCMLFLLPRLGLIGAAWARAASVPVAVVARTVVHHKLVADARWYAGLVILAPVLLVFGMGAMLLLLCDLQPVAWPSLLVGGLFSGMVSGGFAMMLCNHMRVIW